jgi:hypothetical protein
MNALFIVLLYAYAYNCTFTTNVGDTVDLQFLNKRSLPDYIFTTNASRYVFNICKQTFMPCNGTFGSELLKFDKWSGHCQQRLTDSDPTVHYISDSNKWKGVRLRYPNKNCLKGEITVEVQCSPNKGTFVQGVVEKDNCNIDIVMVSDRVCKKAASNAYIFYLMLAVFIMTALYILASVLWSKISNRPMIQVCLSAECWAGLSLKVKTSFNNAFSSE